MNDAKPDPLMEEVERRMTAAFVPWMFDEVTSPLTAAVAVCVAMLRERQACVDALEASASVLRARIAELKSTLASLMSSDDCPKCGSGITGECYGCMVKERDARIAELEKQLKHYTTPILDRRSRED